MIKRRRMTSSTARPRPKSRRLPLYVETLEQRCMFAADAGFASERTAPAESDVAQEHVPASEACPAPTLEEVVDVDSMLIVVRVPMFGWGQEECPAWDCEGWILHELLTCSPPVSAARDAVSPQVPGGTDMETEADPGLDGEVDLIDQGLESGDFVWDGTWDDVTPWVPSGDEMPSVDADVFGAEFKASDDAWMPLPYWRSVTDGEFTDWTTADLVDFSSCGDGFSPLTYPVAYAAAELFGDDVGDQLFVQDPIDDVTSVGGPAIDTLSLVCAEPHVASQVAGEAASSAAAATVDAGKPSASAFAALAGSQGAFANLGSAGLGGAVCHGDGAGDAGFGVRRRVRR
jgi:hypothetical protein